MSDVDVAIVVLAQDIVSQLIPGAMFGSVFGQETKASDEINERGLRTGK
jgi:hypothetical protein